MNVASPLCSALLICSLDQSPTRARPFFNGKKSVPLIRFSGGLSKTRGAALFDQLQAVWHLPLRKACVSALFRRSTTDEMTRLSRTLPWNHPIARILDREVAKWPVGHVAFFVARTGVHSFPHTPFFFLVCSGVFPISTFFGQVLWPIHLCLCPRRCRLNWAARFRAAKCSR